MQVKDLTDINKIERNRNIVIYGSGVTGKICLDILEENDYKVEYFIDDDICTNEPQYFTKNVVSILKQRKNSILDAGAYHGEIISDLFQLGIPVKKLTLFEVEQKNYCQMLNNVKANMLN